MMTRFRNAALLAACTLGLGACAGNYAAEGALGGALIRRDGRCFRIDDDGEEYRVRCPR